MNEGEKKYEHDENFGHHHMDPPKPRQQEDPFKMSENPGSHVKKVYAVVSGKGGVGKSSVTALCALESARRGFRTAILDADITGPSIPRMFGLGPADVGAGEDALLPAVSETGIKVMSMNLLMETEDQPVIWRGPVISGTMKQFWTEVAWGDVDYMFVDLPPGTGDVPLTLFQSFPIDGIIIVTTPQELVEMIVRKAVNMAQTMEIPILGIVENMSFLNCPCCGQKIYPFGESRLQEAAGRAGLPVLGRLPMDPALAKACDEGKVEYYKGEGPEGLSVIF